MLHTLLCHSTVIIMPSSMANSTRRVLRLLQSPATAMVQAKKAPLVASQLLVSSNTALVVAVHQAKSYSAGASPTPIGLAAAMAVTAAGALALVATGFEGPTQCEAPTQQTQAPGGYEGNPIQHVAALLRLYEEIDKNMAVLAGRMLDELEKKVEEVVRKVTVQRLLVHQVLKEDDCHL